MPSCIAILIPSLFRTNDIIPKSTFKEDSYNKTLSRVAFWTAFVSEKIHPA